MTSHLLWTLVALQLAMGAFDIVYHHELVERLPWRRSQAHELTLHGVRDGLYAVLFLTLGWFEVHGFWAVLLIAVLIAEIVITLMDFVEEDVTRKLPASERIAHTLMALNYGAIVVLLLPILVGWATMPTAIVPAWYGVATIVASLASVGIVISGLRDVMASRRMRRLLPSDAAALADTLPGRQHVLITGATGFIGRRLVEALTSAGHEVTVLTRDPVKAATLRPPLRIVTSLAQIPSDVRIDTIVNLAGEPTGNALWTRRKRRKILSSRLRATREVVRLIARLRERPAVLISGSAIGWYGLWQDETLTEFDGGKRCFTHRVCEAWEREAKRAQRLGVRVVRLRIGLVLGIEGGMLGQLLIPYEFGLGGPMGSGRQWMSWIERDDLVRLIAHVIATPSLTGALNATAPNPVTNAAFARALGRALWRPALFRMPATVLHHLGGAFADELMLGGQRVIPDKALASGFTFSHETLRDALDAILGNAPVADLEPHRLVAEVPPQAPRSAPAEQAVHQPAVDASAAASGLLGSLGGRRRLHIGGRRVQGLLHD
jgi:uncharacterized protein (TIGR01777 family)